MLPDYLAPNLQIVFVGINPGTFSARRGHYFARATNMFWTALYQSRLVPEPLRPHDDARLLDFGYGLTDIVARATPNSSYLADEEFVEGGKRLRARVEPLQPYIICFVGLIGYRKAFDRRAVLGEQSPCWGESRLYIVPSTSPRNVFYRPQVVAWFERLAEFKHSLLQSQVTAPRHGGNHE
jgi:TDG/mug DNA glycosylase family protein